MKYPLMRNNIIREDLDAVIEHLKTDDPNLTNGPKVREFEEQWSSWLGVKHSVFVNLPADVGLSLSSFIVFSIFDSIFSKDSFRFVSCNKEMVSLPLP